MEGPERTMSDVEADLEDVAVDDLVVLALDPQLARLFCLVPRAELQELVPVDDLGPDETPLQVGVDDAGTLRRTGAGPERPRPALLVARREEGPPTQQVLGGPGHARESALAQAQPVEELGPLVGCQLGRLGLE